MIIGTGIDIIEVDRVAEKVAKGNGFLEQVFSKREIEWCEARANKNQNYAARFAAKEAFLKATGKGMLLGLKLNEIEIANDADGKPEIVLTGGFKQIASEKGWNKIHLSMSHLQAMACAVVILES